jgi:helix-turn-helix protein
MPNGRCRLHGGLSTGPRTPDGIDRIRKALTKHGRYSAATKLRRERYLGVQPGSPAAKVAVDVSPDSSRLESSPSDSQQEPEADPCRSSESWWNPSKEAAAELVAAGELTIAEIAKRVGVSEKTIDRWKKRPEFQARVNGITANFRERLMAEMLAEIDRDYDFE